MVFAVHPKSKRRFLVIATVAALTAGLVAQFVGVRRSVALAGIGTEILSVRGLSDGGFHQAQPEGVARLPVGGRIGFLANRVECAVVPNGGRAGPDDWELVDGDPGMFFRGEISVPTGLRHVLLRSSGGRGVRTFPALELWLGHVFVVAGQSNAAGSSRTLFTAGSALVRMARLDADGRILRWAPCVDPQVRNGGGSVWPLVGDELSARLGGVPIGFVNCAVGSSSIDDWQPGTPAFQRLDTVLRQLGPVGVRAVLWHQGEADFAMDADTHALRLKALIAEARKSSGSTVPWLVARASFQDGKSSEAVRAAQQELWSEGVAFPGPDTDVLGPVFREDADGVHFNQAGTEAAAELWVDAIAAALFPGAR